MEGDHARLDQSGTWNRWELRANRVSRIVVAEDDHEMRRLITGAMLSDGHVVKEAPDGSKLLLVVIEADPPVDLVISDHRMPVSSGLQVLSGLRRAGWTLPFILLSAFGDDEMRSDAEELGAIFLAKPFDLEALRILVRVALPRP